MKRSRRSPKDEIIKKNMVLMRNIVHLLAHAVNILATLLILRIIISSANILFITKSTIVDYVESVSHWAILGIFIIYIIIDLYGIFSGSISDEAYDGGIEPK